MLRRVIRIVCVVGVAGLILWIAQKSTSYMVAAFETNSDANAAITGSGLSIVAIAIAVWAGLNISNAFDRRELLDYTEELKNRNSIIKDDYESTRKTLHNMYTEEFLRVLSASLDPQHMRISKYLSPILRANDGLVKTDDLIKLIEVETGFNRITLLSRQRSSSDSIIIETKATIKEINDAIEKRGKRDSISDYLIFLRAELFYYSAFAYINKSAYEESVRAFLSAGIGYREYLKRRYRFDISKHKKWGDNYTKEENEEAAYLFNSIGSCYSECYRCYNNAQEDTRGKIASCNEICWLEQKDHYIQYAKTCCELATTISNCTPREVYYRNYGCVFEREYMYHHISNTDADIELLKSAKEQFVRAYYTDRTSKSVYHTIISNYDKQIRHIAGLPIRVQPDANYELNKDSFTNKRSEIGALLQEQLPYIDASRRVFPADCRFVYFYIMCHTYLMLIKENDEEKEKIRSDIAENLRFLSLIAPNGERDIFYKLASTAVSLAES